MTPEGREIERLVWGAWNTEHIANHGVTHDDVEEAIRGDTVARATYKNRLLVLGPSRGRLLAVVIGPVPGQPGAYYTCSARPASRSERRYYQGVREVRSSDEST
jgi:uncharacterized DUF497 family protein